MTTDRGEHGRGNAAKCQPSDQDKTHRDPLTSGTGPCVKVTLWYLRCTCDERSTAGWTWEADRRAGIDWVSVTRWATCYRCAASTERNTPSWTCTRRCGWPPTAIEITIWVSWAGMRAEQLNRLEPEPVITHYQLFQVYNILPRRFTSYIFPQLHTLKRKKTYFL